MHLAEPNPNLGNSVPESLSSTMFYKTCFTLLDSFGHPIKHNPTLSYKTMLDDVLGCFTRLDGPLLQLTQCSFTATTIDDPCSKLRL